MATQKKKAFIVSTGLYKDQYDSIKDMVKQKGGVFKPHTKDGIDVVIIPNADFISDKVRAANKRNIPVIVYTELEAFLDNYNKGE